MTTSLKQQEKIAWVVEMLARTMIDYPGQDVWLASSSEEESREIMMQVHKRMEQIRRHHV